MYSTQKAITTCCFPRLKTLGTLFSFISSVLTIAILKLSTVYGDFSLSPLHNLHALFELCYFIHLISLCLL